MTKKKIAETLNLRVNIGNYQHIEISKYAEQEIEYETKEEMIEKENAFTSDLLDNLVRNLDVIPQKVSKVEEVSVLKVKESIGRAIPEWMNDNQEPNLAKKKSIQSEAEQVEQAEKVEGNIVKADNEIDDLLGGNDTKSVPEEKVEVENGKTKEKVVVAEDDLFGESDLF
jgi:hypothetical protein